MEISNQDYKCGEALSANVFNTFLIYSIPKA